MFFIQKLPFFFSRHGSTIEHELKRKYTVVIPEIQGPRTPSTHLQPNAAPIAEELRSRLRTRTSEDTK